MQRLDYRLRDFTWHSWANDESRVVWEPRIDRVCACIKELEWRSILEGIRACALRAVSPDELQTHYDTLSGYGLTVVPLEKYATENRDAASRRIPREGEPFKYWCAIGRMPDIQKLESAERSHDAEAVGRLLGYPACCRRFFNQAWVDAKFIDTTWPMAQNTVAKRIITPLHVEIVPVSRCNVLLQWLGPISVFHLPCSFDCQATVQLADQLTDIASSAGFDEEMDWLEEMLNWPVEWTALNGLAEITTPVGTTSTVTDATAERYRVSYRGHKWTDECEDRTACAQT